MKEREIHIFALFVSAIFLWPFVIFANNIPVPVVNLDYQVELGQEIFLDASDTLDIDGDELSFFWDFGDGTQSEGITTSHIYKNIGNHIINLTVIDGYDASLANFVINVVENNQGGGSGNQNQVITYSDAIVINELMPNPDGSDNYEWVELFNPSDIIVDLVDWVISDASGKKYIIDSDDFVDTTIAGHGFFIIPRAHSSIALNNSGDSLELFNPSGTRVNKTEYNTSAGNNITWALDNAGVWEWSIEPTKGFTNIIRDEVEDEVVVNSNSQIEVELLSTITSTVPNTNIQYATSGDIVITETLPAPAGDDREYEFIEIYNNSDFVVDLAGWKLFDLKTDFIFESIIINPEEYLLLERQVTKIALNNTGDVITLVDAEENIIDIVEYSKANNNQSYIRSGDEWVWTNNITPGEAYIAEDKTSIGGAPVVLGFSEDVNLNFIQSISEIYNYDTTIDTIITVQGSISASPGELDKRILYIADQSGGVQVYMHNSDWPELELGDIIEVTGIISQAYGEYRIKIKKAEDIKFITSGEVLDSIELCKTAFFDIGSFIEISGKMIKKHKPYIDIETDCEDKVFEIIKLKLNNDLLSVTNRDDSVIAKGIVRIRNDNLFVHVLELKILPVEDLSDEIIINGVEEDKKNISITIDGESEGDKLGDGLLDSFISKIYVIILLIVSVISVVFYLKKKKYKY